MEKTSNQVVRSVDVISKDVFGSNKEKLGKIEEIVLIQLINDTLKLANGFDKDNWPDFANETYGKSLNDYYRM